MENNTNQPKLNIVRGSFDLIKEDDLKVASQILSHMPYSPPADNHSILYMVDNDGNHID